MSYTYYELNWLFLIYSLAGWCLCVIAEAVRRKKFADMGVLNLPVMPVFGFSAVATSVLLSELKTEPVFLFIGGMLIGAFLVSVNNIILKHIFHRDWRERRFHYLGTEGVITIPILIIGGAGTLFVFYIGNPLILRAASWIPQFIGHLIQWISFGALALDLLGTLAVVWGWRRYINRMAGLTDNMQALSVNFGTVISRPIIRRLERSYPNIETQKIIETKAAEQPKQQNVFAEGCCFYKLALIFVLGGLLGDLVETVYCRFSLGYWMSRSSMVYGPFSIIWGAFAVLLTAFLYRHRDKSDRYIFVYGTVVGGLYEYICSVITELMFGATFWNYKNLPFNLGGRINLLFCFFWGIASVIWLKILFPRVSDLIEKIPIKTGKIVTWILMAFLSVDMAISAAAFSRYSHRVQGTAEPTVIGEFLDQHFDDARMKKIYPKSKIIKKSADS